MKLHSTLADTTFKLNFILWWYLSFHFVKPSILTSNNIKKYLCARILRGLFLLYLYWELFMKLSQIHFRAHINDLFTNIFHYVKRNFCSFDPASVNVTAPSSVAKMFFEKKSFFYWLDDGVVEISVESQLKGTWRTMDNNLSAKGK